MNLRALRARTPGHPSVGRFGDLAGWLTGHAGATPEEGIAWVADLCRALRVPGLASYGLGAGDVPALVERARMASSMRGNPIAITRRTDSPARPRVHSDRVGAGGTRPSRLRRP